MTKTKLLALSLSSGVLLAFPWLGITGISLCVAFIPLLFVEAYFYQHRNSHKSYIFFLYSYLTFFVWSALSVWWLWHATKTGMLFFVFFNSFLLAIIWWSYHLINRKQGRSSGMQFLVLAWLSFEYVNHNWGMSMPGLSLGNGFSNEPYLVQWYEFTGILGGSAWVLLLNLVGFLIVSNYLTTGIFKNIQIKIGIGLFMLPVLLSIFLYYNYSEKESPVNVVIAQPNIDPFTEKFGQISFNEQCRLLLTACDSLGEEDTDVFIGPETALNKVNEAEIPQDTAIQQITQFLKKYPKAVFVVGATGYRTFPEEDKPKESYNSSYLLSSDSGVQVYHKSKLVVGVEKMPFEKYLHFLDKYMIGLGEGQGSYTTQDAPTVFIKDSILIGVPICYESAYGEYVSTFVKQGAQIIAIITNDGWFKTSPGTRLHLGLARLRAVETRRSIARCGNTGISCFINQRGDIIAQTKLNTYTALKGALNRNDRISMYTKHGDYLGRIALLLVLLLLIKLWVKKQKAEWPSV